MSDRYDPVPDLAWLLDSALVFNGTDAYEAARRIAEHIGISEDDRDGAAERALRRALGAWPGPRPFRIRVSPDHLATVDRPASLADDRSDTVADTLGNRWHLAPPPPKASCSNCGADLTWSWDTSAWARADEPERGREICRQPSGTWKPHVAQEDDASAVAGEENGHG